MNERSLNEEDRKRFEEAKRVEWNTIHENKKAVDVITGTVVERIRRDQGERRIQNHPHHTTGGGVGHIP